MLCVIAVRNFIEMAGSDIAFLPQSFIRGKSLVESILSVRRYRNSRESSTADVLYLSPKPVLFVIISEMLVDWLKHAFITKFNHVRSSVYGRFTDVLAKDVLLAGSLNNIRNLINGRTVRHSSCYSGNSAKNTLQHPVLLDQSPLVARRLGFASIPLACLVIRVGAQAIGMLTNSSHHTEESSDPHGGWAWLVIRWTAGIGIGLIAWGWSDRL